MSGGKRLLWVLAAAVLLPACARFPSGASPSASPVVAPLEPVGKLQKVAYAPGTYAEELKSSEYRMSPAAPQAASYARLVPPLQSASHSILYYTFGNGMYGLAIGPGGSIWFSSYGKVWFGKLSRNGTIQSYTLPSAPYRQGGYITSTPDGAIWVAQNVGGESLMGRLSLSGSYQQFPVHGRLLKLSPAPDNSVWSVEREEKQGDKIVQVSSAGQETDYILPKGELYGGRALWGPDGAVWFPITSGIGRLNPDGSYSRLKVAGQPQDIAFAPDGTMWTTTAYGAYIGALQHWTTSGTQIASQPLQVGAQVIAVGGDGTVWFTGGLAPTGGTYVPVVGRFKAGRLDTYGVYEYAADLVVAGNSVWFTGNNGISVFTPSD